MKYFAYGSNMSLARLRVRVPSARMLDTGHLRRHALRFHKHGRDDSAKCDARFTDSHDDIVHGVLFDIPETEKAALDRAEDLGHGYEEKAVIITGSNGVEHPAFTYYAIRINTQLKPYHWYLQHVLNGAVEAGLPESYIALIKRVSVMDDPDTSRSYRELAIYNLDIRR